MYKLRLGRSVALINDNFYDALNEIKSLGYDSLDFDLCGKWVWEDQAADGYKAMRKGLEAVKELGLYFNGVHVPFGRAWDFSSIDEEKRSGAVASFAAIASIIDEYSPNCYIVHGSYEPVAVENREAQISALKKSLSEMLKVTKTTIAVEVLPRTCLLNTAAEANAIIDSMASEQIRICVDVNHFLQETSEMGVLGLGKRIVTTHISDHDYENERHWMPGEGKIDWMALIGSFEKIGYEGVFNYESAGTSAEVKANYEKLFEEYNRR